MNIRSFFGFLFLWLLNGLSDSTGFLFWLFATLYLIPTFPRFTSEFMHRIGGNRVILFAQLLHKFGAAGMIGLPIMATWHIGTVWSFMLAGLVTALIEYRLEGGEGESVIRGSSASPGRRLQRRLAKTEDFDLTIGNIPFPRRLEPLHLLLVGATGTGKSVAINELLPKIAERGDRAFVADVGGVFTRHYFDEARGDIILNPLDERSVTWSPLAEMAGPWDADRLARSIVPPGEGNSKEWNTYAQAMIGAILDFCWTNDQTNSEIFRLGVMAPISELSEILAGTPAESLTGEDNARMFASVRAIVGTYLGPYRFLDPDAGRNAFSLKRWIEAGTKGWAFFNVKDDQMEALKPLIACLIDVTSVSLLSLEPDSKRRFWLMLDEFASFGRVGSVVDFLTKARKYGGRAVIGLQSVSQLAEAYGHAGAQTVLSCLSSCLCLRVSDPDTAEAMSRRIGERQVVRELTSRSETRAFGGDSETTSTNQQIANERSVMPSELQGLPDLHGVLDLAGDIPYTLVVLEPRSMAPVAESFVPRDLSARAPANRAAAPESAGADSGDQAAQLPF